jgi:hypothetical protein
MSIDNFDNNESRDNEWFYSRLIEQKEKEIKIKKEIQKKNG